MNAHEITVIIPTIPPRANDDLARAVQSVGDQTHPATTVIVEVDNDREGPAVVRNRAVERVETDWIAFLDDDDYMLPNHLEVLARTQDETAADLVWSWFETEPAGADPFPPHFFGRQWIPEEPHQIPITYLLRTEAFRAVGGFDGLLAGKVRTSETCAGEDWRLQLMLSNAGYKFAHVAERTWVWRHHGANTSGLPDRW